ncbi:hypothetical protein P4T04_03200, partial [Bacillus badius]|uniref:hypothetical protein n=1 Tax=Bacillus badius TaxID=1455 RepID=UPI002E1B9FC9|nr:hypothetical protein [Bacillus badius]
ARGSPPAPRTAIRLEGTATVPIREPNKKGGRFFIQTRGDGLIIPFSNRYSYTAALFLYTLLIGMEGVKTPAGSAGQVRPRRRFSAEEAHRPPRGKRNAWNGRQLLTSASQIKKAEDKLNFH